MIAIPALDRYDRQEMSPHTLAIAVVLAAGDAGRPLPHFDDVDWNEVFQAVCHNGILGIAYHYLCQRQAEDYPPADFRTTITHAYRLEALRMALIHRYVRSILEPLSHSEIDHLVVKGPAVAYSWYPNPMARTFNDLDLVIRERDWSAMHRFLEDLGYQQKENLPSPPPKLISQAVPYETKYIHRETGFRVEVHYDDILNAGIAARDIERFWQRAITVDAQGLSFRTLSPEDQLIHLCAHMHYHGYTRLNWFTDIACMIRNHQQRIDWERLLQTVMVEDVRVPVYYSLYFLEKLMKICPPAEVMAKLRPGAVQRYLHEFYLPEEKILAFQPMPRPDMSFYFLPLYKRLLPDLLVMGRRAEKLNYLAHLLIPPREWLTYYYQIENANKLPLHYILHPLKLLAHYVRETLLLITKRQYVDY